MPLRRHGMTRFGLVREMPGVRRHGGGLVVCRPVTEIRAEITANVWMVNVEAGQVVAEGDELVIPESMKMELPVVAPAGGTVAEVHVKPEDHVNEGDLIVTLS